MSGRKNQGIFHIVIGNRGGFRLGHVSDPVGDVLSVTDLVGTDPFGGFGRGGLVRLAVVERPSRRLLRRWKI